MARVSTSVKPKQDNLNRWPSPDQDGLRGHVFDDFEVIEEIGRGGMGVVYKARQISLDRIVALKILSASTGLTETAITRFRREAQAAAKLHHPHIVPIFAQGKLGRTYYYAMELVSGLSLYEIICEKQAASGLPTRAGSGSAADIALAETELIGAGSLPDDNSQLLASGSQIAAESSGTIIQSSVTEFDEMAAQIRSVADALQYAHDHGVIHRDVKPHNLLLGAGNRLCISDFGLARVLEQPGVTVSGEFIGSPLYMSAEQVTGRYGAVDHRTDIYSLGATLYQWMTLHPPFPGQTREQVISSIITSDPVPPRTFNSTIPIDLETICMKALEKDPSKRYQTASELRDDLQRFLDRAHIRARRAGLVARAAKHVSKRRVAATVCVASLMVLLLSTELFRQRDEVKKTQDVVRKVVEDTSQQVEEVKKENLKLQQRLIALGGNLGRALQPAAAGFLSQASDDSDEYRPVSDERRLGAMFFSSLVEQERRRREGTDPNEIESGSAEDYYLRGVSSTSHDETLSYLDKCLKLDERHYEARLLRAWAYCQSSRTNAMLADAEELISQAPDRGEGYLVRGTAYLLQDELDECLTSLERAVKSLAGHAYIDVVIGIAQVKSKSPDAALGSLSRALIMDPDNVLALMKRAELAYDTDHIPVAIVDLARVIELEPENAEAYEARGRCYNAQHRYELAHSDFLKAYSISGKALLLWNITTAAANLSEQRKSEEAKTENTSKAEPALPVSTQEKNPQQWLKDFLDKRYDDGRDTPTQSVFPAALSAFGRGTADAGTKPTDYSV